MRRIGILTLLIGLAGCSGSDEAKKDFELVILHTGDRHSHFLGLPNAEYDPTTTGDGTMGGIARLATLIEQERAEHPDALLLSSGDFTMGTLFMATEDNAADLNIMSLLGYNAAALGNHEFDWGPQSLANMINAADQPVIPLLASNMSFSADKPEDDGLEALFGPQGQADKLIHPYLIHETSDGIRIGIIGLLGVYAASVTHADPVKFSEDIDDMAETTQALVNQLRKEEKVDALLALAHLGIIMEGDTPTYETIDLAERVEGIDIILSGHKHTVVETALEIPCQVEGSDWTTLTMEAGSFGQYLGRYELKRESGVVSTSGQLIPVDDTIPASAEVNQRVGTMIAEIADYLRSNYPIVPEDGAFLDGDPFQVLSHSSFELPRRPNEPSNLAYLVTDAMRETAGTELAVLSNGGDIRKSLTPTNGDELCLSDVFIVTPLGIGPDGLLGYPLARTYLYLSELKAGLEGSSCDRGLTNNDFMLSTSGLRVVFDSRRSVYDRIIRLTQYENLDESDIGTVLYDVDNGGFQVDAFSTLVSVCVSSYIAGLFNEAGLTPRRADGTPVTGSLDELLVREGDMEIKLWYAFARKLASFTGEIPDQYNPDESQNPVGPYWRRIWDLAQHPE